MHDCPYCGEAKKVKCTEGFVNTYVCGTCGESWRQTTMVQPVALKKDTKEQDASLVKKRGRPKKQK